jgi:hypothetical protein
MLYAAAVLVVPVATPPSTPIATVPMPTIRLPVRVQLYGCTSTRSSTGTVQYVYDDY